MNKLHLPPEMKKMDLVFSGSSTKFFAHIGCWMGLRHYDIQPVRVAANSGGALIAALKLSGYSLEDIAKVARDTDLRQFIHTGWRDLLRLISRGYLSDGSSFLSLLEQLFGSTKFKDIATPFYVMTSDITRGRLRVLTQKTDPNMSIALAVYMSSCMPLAFKPVVLQEHGGMGDPAIVNISYRDGGLYKDFPIDIWKDQPRWRLGHIVGKAKQIKHKNRWTGKDEAFMLADRAVDANVDSSVEHIPDPSRTLIVESDGYNISSLKFDLTQGMKEALQDQGFNTTLAALKPFAVSSET